jgi:predicted transcriptional regulator
MLVAVKDMRIILTADALYPSIEAVGLEQVSKAIEKNFKLHMLKQNLKIGFFAVTDRFMAFVPYRLDGTFDWSSDLLNCNKTAIDWGLALFDHYNELAESVDLSQHIRHLQLGVLQTISLRTMDGVNKHFCYVSHSNF